MNKPYVTPDICGPCGGQCCLKVPGANWPQDFGLPRIKKQLREALDSGRYAIDWWEGDPRHDYHDDDEMGCAYFVRPAVKGMEGVLRDPTWGGPCTFLEEGVGCVLDPKQRPRACRWLEPKPDAPRTCEDHTGGKREVVLAWLPYNDLLENWKRQENTR